MSALSELLSAPRRLSKLHLEEGALYVSLNRPQQRNALNQALVRELSALFDALTLAPPPEIRVVVLRGEGEHFCAGGDVRDMSGASPEELKKMNRAFGSLLQQLTACPLPIIAALEGVVMGGGVGLACAADLSLSLEGVRFKLPEVSLGLTPAQITPFVVRKVGVSVTKRLALTGVELSGEQAQACGLVDEHHLTRATYKEALEALIMSLKRGAPRALGLTKQLIERSSITSEEHLDELLDEASERFSEQCRGEAQEGLAALRERRAPLWRA